MAVVVAFSRTRRSGPAARIDAVLDSHVWLRVARHGVGYVRSGTTC